MTTITTLPKTERLACRLDALSLFLKQHSQLLTAVSYDTVDALDPDADYKDQTWADFYTQGGNLTISVNGPGQREMVRTIRRAIGGKWEKGGYGNTFLLRQQIPAFLDGVHITVEISMSREQVCIPVVVGKRTRTIPAVEAAPERTVTEDEVEWQCGNLLDG